MKVACPYCGEKVSKKGVHSHVMNSDGNGHGEYREKPEDFDMEELEPIQADGGTEAFTQYDSGTDTDHYYLCHYCDEVFDGERGFKIHLSKSQGRGDHPHDVDYESADYTLIPTNDRGDPIIDRDEISSKRLSLLDTTESFGVGRGFDQHRRTEVQPGNVPGSDQYDLTMIEQVAKVIEDNPDRYHDKEEIMDELDCSQSTFYKGRALYDMLQKNNRSVLGRKV